jgi:hypothetical protein
MTTAHDRINQLEWELNQCKQALPPQHYMTAPLQGPISPAMRKCASAGKLVPVSQQVQAPSYAQGQPPWAPMFNTAGSGAAVTSKQHQEIMSTHHLLLQVVGKQQETHKQLMAAHTELMKVKAQAAQPGGPLEKPKTKPPALGIVRLDYDYPPAEGDTDCPASFGYDVYYRCVPGLTFEMAQDGQFTEQVERNFADAIKWLEMKGAGAITGDCGFMMAFQVIARKIASAPVCMSSMVQCPIISCAIDDDDKILILTANAKSLKPQKEVLLTECGFKVDDDKFIIVGCQDVEGFDAVSKGKKVPLDIVQPGVVRLAADVLRKHPDIGAILLECTELPPYADALRQALRLPVWDAITCADFYISAKQDNPRFGVNEWQEHWDGVQEEYNFGQNLLTSEKAELVNKIQGGKARLPGHMAMKSTVKKLQKAQCPCLGVVRLDYDYPPSAGDIDHPGSFDYRVIFRCVPGLTFEMCQSGRMTPPVLEQFKKAIKWLEKEGAVGITGDCGFMMAFQVIARRTAKVPVFMSSMVQCPMVSVAIDMYEKILVLTANSESLKPQKEVLLEHCGFEVTSDRFVIRGCQDVPGFDAVSKGEKVDVEKVTPGIVKLVLSILDKQPAIRAVVSECTELPPYSDAIRHATKLPVFDSITCCDFFISAYEDNPRFGMNQWQNDWNGQTEQYRLGSNLSAAERRKLLNN